MPVKAIVTIFRRQYRAKTILALFVLGMVQLSGIDGVLYVSPKVIQSGKFWWLRNS